MDSWKSEHEIVLEDKSFLVLEKAGQYSARSEHWKQLQISAAVTLL